MNIIHKMRNISLPMHFVNIIESQNCNMLRKLFKKKTPLNGSKAKEAYLEIERYMQDKSGKMECPKPSSGLFRDDSYDWTVYNFYEQNSKMIFKVALILLIGMISLNGYSSTTTHVTEKKDTFEKLTLVTTLGVGTEITKTQIVSVENTDQDVGLFTNIYNYSKSFDQDTGQFGKANYTDINVTDSLRRIPMKPIAGNPPPLILLE
jgi:hypothetical protein